MFRYFAAKLVRKVCVVVARHLPKRVIHRDEGDEYLERYYVCGRSPPYPNIYSRWPHTILGFLPTVYLHRFVRSDEDRELHNHPWAAISLILAGGYREERRVGDGVTSRIWKPGQINHIGANDFHRVDLLEKDAWTLFITGEKAQSWGFWSRDTDEFVHWREHMARAAAKAT